MDKIGKSSLEKWEQYTNMGQQLPGTRLIPFKSPVNDSLLNNSSTNTSVDFFDVRAVMDHCSNLGLVIDLTNNEKYYDPKQFIENKVSYYKLKAYANVIPVDHIVFKFFEVVEGFLEKNKNNNKLIGVHCLDGVNITGYFIIRYMIQQLNVSPDEAISAFNSARGHALERESYLQNLRKALWPKVPRFPLKSNSGMSKNSPMDSRFSGRPIRRDNELTPPYFPHHSKNRAFPYKEHGPHFGVRPGPYRMEMNQRNNGTLPPSDYFRQNFDMPSPPTRKQPLLPLPDLNESNGQYSSFNQRRHSSGPDWLDNNFECQRKSYSPAGSFNSPRLQYNSPRLQYNAREPLLQEPNLTEDFDSYPPYDRKQSFAHNRSAETFNSPPYERRPLLDFPESNTSGPAFDFKGKHPEPNTFSHTPDKRRSLGSGNTSYTLDEPFSPPNFRIPSGESGETPKLGMGGKAYYEQYFGGEARSQYESDFYRRDGGGIGPHRPLPRNLPSLLNDGGQPRQYKGPRSYYQPKQPDNISNEYTRRTPPKPVPLLREGLLSPGKGLISPLSSRNTSGDFRLPVDGPSRRILSPGSRSNLYSPEGEWTPRSRNTRFQPY